MKRFANNYMSSERPGRSISLRQIVYFDDEPVSSRMIRSTAGQSRSRTPSLTENRRIACIYFTYSTMSTQILRTFTIARQSVRLSSISSIRSYAVNTNTTMDPQTVSDMAKAEGGAAKGSPAAQAQSQMSKEINNGSGTTTG